MTTILRSTSTLRAALHSEVMRLVWRNASDSEDDHLCSQDSPALPFTGAFLFYDSRDTNYHSYRSIGKRTSLLLRLSVAATSDSTGVYAVSRRAIARGQSLCDQLFISRDL